MQRPEGFIYWAVTGFLGAGAILSLMTIGALLVPFAVLAAFLTARRYSIGLETIGLIAGVGLAAVGIGLLSLGNHPCPSGPIVFAPGQVGAAECGGANPIPWLLGGLASIWFAVVTRLWLKRQTHGRLGA